MFSYFDGELQQQDEKRGVLSSNAIAGKTQNRFSCILFKKEHSDPAGLFLPQHILTELKTKAAERNIPFPDCLAECLREVKTKSTSEYVVPNRDGDPLSYTQFKRLWQYIVTRTTKERS